MLAEIERVLAAAARGVNSLPDWDRAEALEQVRGDAELLELAKLFWPIACPHRMTELEKALLATAVNCQWRWRIPHQWVDGQPVGKGGAPGQPGAG